MMDGSKLILEGGWKFDRRAKIISDWWLLDVAGGWVLVASKMLSGNRNFSSTTSCDPASWLSLGLEIIIPLGLHHRKVAKACQVSRRYASVAQAFE